MTSFDNPDDKVTFSINSDSKKLYDVTIRVAAIYGEKYTNLILNGGSTSQVHFPATTEFVDVSVGPTGPLMGQLGC